MKFSMKINKKLLKSVINIAEKAGNEIMAFYKKHDVKTTIKEDKSPLTEADLVSHQIIYRELSKLTPDISILSEESSVKFELENDRDFYWCVDPLDGTKEFLKKNGEFTVNIALIYDQKPVMGVIVVPAKNTTYSSLEGLGSFKSVINSTNLSPIHVKEKVDKNNLTFATSRSHSDSKTQLFIKKNNGKEIKVGSSLKFVLIAEGSCDVYPRFAPTMIWDTAAGHSILIEAGGFIAKPNKGTLTYNPNKLLNSSFIASNIDSELLIHNDKKK